ncbi:MAG: hypothetical protein HDS51_00165 [Barnesiella sp.]|nr:hypothetical protein [Barnesiella sp.]
MTTKEKALSQNKFIHRYIIAAAHAILWIAALSLAAYVHLDNRFTPHQALLFSTLVAYCAYLCESGLGAWRFEVAHSANRGNFRKLKIRRWIILNIFVAVTLSILFLLTAYQWLLACIIATAGWQKYMDGRIPPRLEETLGRK